MTLHRMVQHQVPKHVIIHQHRDKQARGVDTMVPCRGKDSFPSQRHQERRTLNSQQTNKRDTGRSVYTYCRGGKLQVRVKFFRRRDVLRIGPRWVGHRIRRSLGGASVSRSHVRGGFVRGHHDEHVSPVHRPPPRGIQCQERGDNVPKSKYRTVQSKLGPDERTRHDPLPRQGKLKRTNVQQAVH